MDYLANDLNNYLISEYGAKQVTEPRQDPFGAAWLSTFDPTLPISLRWGRIVDAIPFANAYRVSFGPQSFAWCTLGVTTGLQPHGARLLNTLPIGCAVFCIVHPDTHHWPLIVAVDPPRQSDNRAFRPDYIWPGSRSGMYIDSAHQLPLSQAGAGGVQLWNAGRPMDSTTAGEWGAITETGLAIYLDPFMGYVRVDEETGLFVFYHDQLARLAGHNLQIRSSVGEREDLDDEGEAIRIGGHSPYFWERQGVFLYSSSGHREFSDTTSQQAQQEYAVLEPLYDDQQAFYRCQEFAGYLGQGGKRILSLPPIAAITPVNRYQDANIFPGVFEEQLSLTGAWSVRSAKRIIISKRPGIPTPKMLVRPEDIGGDTPANYKAASMLGSGVDHVVIDEPATSVSASIASLQRAAAVLDLNAFAFNWEGSHPFAYHDNDWLLPEEGDTALGPVAMLPPSFSSLAANQYLSPPFPTALHVDHRYGEADYYPTESFIALLDDGGIVLGDGSGAEIKMAGGSIFMSCPGDIWMQPGKNLNCWAGWDFVAKAFNSADITTSRKDVRIKAENNVMVLAGNNGCGGVVIESQASCAAYNFTGNTGEDVVTSGIVLKAPNSQVVCWGYDVINQAKAPVGAARKGHIILDADDGKIRSYAIYHERFTETANFDFFVDSLGGVSASNEFWSNCAFIGTPMRIHGGVIMDDCLLVKHWIEVSDGHIATSAAATYSNQVPRLAGSDLSTAVTNVGYVTTRATELVTIGQQEYDTTERGQRTSDLSKVEVTMRTAAQCYTSDLKLFENRWQQIARINGAVPDTWAEPAVTSSVSSTVTYPHPGKEPWITTLAWYRQNLNLYDATVGTSKSRTANQGLYEAPTYDSPTTVVLEGNYPIIRSS